MVVVVKRKQAPTRRVAKIPGVLYVTRRRGRQILDRETRRTFDIGGTEFIRRYRTGETDDLNESDVSRLAILIPLAEH